MDNLRHFAAGHHFAGRRRQIHPDFKPCSISLTKPQIAFTGGDIFWAADDELDVSARYAITPSFEVYVDASNLLNGPGRRFAGISQRTIEHETFGARYTAGFRLTY